MKEASITMYLKLYLLTGAVLMNLFSCNRIKEKGQAVVHKTREKVSEVKQKVIHKKNEWVDGIFPIYDSYTSDTENNKRRFKEHLQVELSNDVKEIYTYGDFFGADYCVRISFRCDESTVEKIVLAKQMTLSTETQELGMSLTREFTWWDEERISSLTSYKIGEDGKFWEYLWFDRQSKTAYYEEFSL